MVVLSAAVLNPNSKERAMTTFGLHNELSHSYSADVARAVRHRAERPLDAAPRRRTAIATTGRRLLAAATVRPARRTVRPA